MQETSGASQNVLIKLKEMFRKPALDRVATGVQPRPAITAALVASFVDVLETIQPGVVMEIGAHEAAFSCTIKQKLTQSRVAAFEANPYVFARFKDSPRIKRSGIEYISLAVSDMDGEAELILPLTIAAMQRPLHGGTGSLNALARSDVTFEKVAVQTTTLDTFLQGDSRLLAMWLDVEGAVDKVIAGAHSTMPRVQAIFCEVEDQQFWQGQTTDNEVISLLRQWRLIPVLCDCQARHQYNMVFIKEDLLNVTAISRSISQFHSRVASITEDARQE